MRTILTKLSLLALMLLTASNGFAYDFEMDGIYYYISSLEDMTCGVTSGDVKYTGDVIIPSEVIYKSKSFKVTCLNANAFKGCSSLESITIPNSVTSIGWQAFSHCTSLESITIPNSVTSISHSTFEYCTSLESINIPNSVTEIEIEAFRGCSSLESITIPNSVTEIGRDAFYRCTSLESITIPNSVTKIRQQTFIGCTSLKSITIPNSVTSIWERVFSGCTSLESITIPNSVTILHDYAFENCNNLKSVILSNSLTSIDYGMFMNCEKLESLEIPGSVVELHQSHSFDYDTFKNCISLSKLRLASGSERLVTGYWRAWTETIKELYIDRELEYNIPVPNLEKLEIGESVKKVQVDRLSSCSNLMTIYSYASVPPELPTMSNEQYMDATVYVPEAALEAYKKASSWKIFWNIVPISNSGIDDVETDSNEPVHIYNMNGIEMTDKESLPSGIYIERQGAKSRKIVVR